MTVKNKIRTRLREGQFSGDFNVNFLETRLEFHYYRQVYPFERVLSIMQTDYLLRMYR